MRDLRKKIYGDEENEVVEAKSYGNRDHERKEETKVVCKRDIEKYVSNY